MSAVKRAFLLAATSAIALAGTADAQIGSGWTQFTASGFIDFQCGGNHTHKSIASSISVQGARYTNSGGVETFKLTDNSCNRIEHQNDEHYSSGKRQMEGYVKISQLSAQSVHQIFHGTTGPFIMVKGYTSNGGELRKLSGSVVLASHVSGVYVRYNHLTVVGSSTKIYINGSLKYSGGGPAADGSGNNNKYGLYGTKVTSAPVVNWKNVKFFR